MRLARIIFIIGLAALTGCTTGRLRQRTINQGSTLPELQYQQVLDNLAQFATNPSALPWHVNLREGTTQITDSISGGAALDLGPPVTWFPQLLGSRTAVAQWGMSPVIDATELRLLRIAYRRAHGAPDMPSPEFLDELAHELKDQFASNADLRNESELFYEFQSRTSRSSKELDAHVITTNDDSVLRRPRALARSLSAGEKRLPKNRDDSERPRDDPTRLVPRGSQARRPEGRLLRREVRATPMSGSAPKGVINSPSSR